MTTTSGLAIFVARKRTTRHKRLVDIIEERSSVASNFVDVDLQEPPEEDQLDPPNRNYQIPPPPPPSANNLDDDSIEREVLLRASVHAADDGGDSLSQTSRHDHQRLIHGIQNPNFDSRGKPRTKSQESFKMGSAIVSKDGHP